MKLAWDIEHGWNMIPWEFQVDWMNGLDSLGKTRGPVYFEMACIFFFIWIIITAIIIDIYYFIICYTCTCMYMYHWCPLYVPVYCIVEGRSYHDTLPGVNTLCMNTTKKTNCLMVKTATKSNSHEFCHNL